MDYEFQVLIHLKLLLNIVNAWFQEKAQLSEDETFFTESLVHKVHEVKWV